MATHKFSENKMRLTLYTTTLKYMHSIEVESLHFFYICKTLLIRNKKRRPPLLIAIDTKLRFYCYSLLNHSISTLALDFDLHHAGVHELLATENMPYFFRYLLLNMTLMPSYADGKTSVALSGLRRLQNAGYKMYMFAGKLTLNL